ncbi:MAG: hypothetical protein VX252_14690 [Myxococcota bacterium]|nr:hypothetical protein [Myxococcota bacterium]
MQSFANKLHFILATLAVLLMASASSAVQLSMTGEWWQNRGAKIDIPAGGGPAVCTGMASTGCQNGVKPELGGIPGAANVPVDTGAPGAPAFTLPPSAFSSIPTVGWVMPVAGNPTVQQLASTFTFMGPGPFGPNASGNPLPAKMQANAWSQDPNQAARVGATFSWCPGGGATAMGGGAGVQNCTNPGDATPTAAGNWNGRIKYTPGANAFGGTMSMIMGGVGWVAIRIATPAPSGPRLGHQLVGGGQGRKAQIQGIGYAVYNFNDFPAGPFHKNFRTWTQCTQATPPRPYTDNFAGLPAIGTPAGGTKPAVGPIAGRLFCENVIWQGTNFGNFIPPDSNINFGFPWTTGMITVSETGFNGTKPASTVLVNTGTDNRTSMGVGTITLVAGAITHRYSNNNPAGPNPQNFAAMDIVNMTFGGSPVPAMSPMGLASAAVLIVLAVGYAFRKRLVTND